MYIIFIWGINYYLCCLIFIVRVVLLEEMVKDGYNKIMNIDILDVLIEVMIIKYKYML